MLSHKAMVAEGAQIKAWTKPILTEWEDPVMITPPLFHVYGNAAIAAAAIMGHNPMVLIPDPRDHKDLIKTIKKTEPAFFPAVPTLFTALANHPDFKSGKMDFKFMKLCLSGAAPFATGARTAFEALTGHRIFQAYGLTETTGAITIEPLGKLGKEGSVGLPLPDVVIKIVDIETGNRDLPNGETGEIIVKCPQVMTGFWNSLEETTEMIKDGWLHTGDIGHLDKDGYLFLTSRKKQLIKVSGFQVWPQEIVEVLKMHPMVEDACVGGIPDPVQGEAVKAWVVLRKGYETNATALQAFCRQKLTAYKIPRYVEFRDSLPRNLYGQELCRKLVEEEKARNAPPHVTG
jgi:long-chain acyl-CoA synthetase